MRNNKNKFTSTENYDNQNGYGENTGSVQLIFQNINLFNT